jgi:phenylacetate-CoA ligase
VKLRKYSEIVAAKRGDRALARHEAWTPEQVRVYQRDRVDSIVRHAATSSSFYADLYDGLLPESGRIELGSLPPLDKETFVEHFDEIVTDPRLRRDELFAHVEDIDDDVLYRGEFRVIATSGSSGRKGLFVFDRAGWSRVMSGFLRFTRWTGAKPAIPRRRLAYIGASNGAHMSRRMSGSLDIGMHRMIILPATMPLARIVDALNRFQPDYLPGFPSMIAALAEEQLAGRLQISPRIVSTSSELRTAEMTRTIEAAWGTAPWDLYGVTETGIVGCECEEHHGIHLFEDLAVIEVVDADGNPVPDGVVGDQILVTSLDNRVQPTIRLAVSDRVAIDPEPCRCGLPLRRIRGVDGRADDILHLPSSNGATIPVHPFQWAPVAKAREVREFQIVQEGPAVNVRVVLHPGADASALEQRLTGELGAGLRALGIAEPIIRLRPCGDLGRDAAKMGKLKLVVADELYPANAGSNRAR